MKKRKLTPLTVKEIAPQGWLLRQLTIQAEGLSGHLDLIWPDIRDSRWIGGDKEGWERVPYWLDGFIPLAWLLDRDDLKERAKKYVDAILDRQCEDGWICPCSEEERNTYDVWAAFLICKVLVVYYECTGEERIWQAVYRAMKNLLSHITSRNTLFNWAAARWYECLVPLLWLYERKPEEWMLQLIYVLEAEGIDYEKLYSHFDFARPAAAHYWTQLDHVVNTAMALKARGLMSLVTGEDPDAAALHMYRTLMEHNSMVTGHFTGDECLVGDSPIQGSELCSVAEAMYSYETLLSVGGNPFWADLLEKEAFNCMPATTTADMWAHQYVQMTNQICCAKIPEGAVHFSSNSGESHLFGLEPNYGCCTANFNQAWPKFALSAVMASDRGLAVNSLVPCRAEVCREGIQVMLTVDSAYPFRDGGCIRVETKEPVEFELLIRIPGSADGAQVDGRDATPGTFYRIQRTWEGCVEIPVRFLFEAKLVERPYGNRAVVRGPLVFCLPIEARSRKLEYVKDGVERKFPYCDYEMTPVSDWNYGFASDAFQVEFGEIGKFPFDPKEPPIRLRAKMVKVPWEAKNGVCAVTPTERKALGAPEEKLLSPYGCTDLRMTEMPYL